MDLYTAWRAYCDFQQKADMTFAVTECGVTNLEVFSLCDQPDRMVCSYKGIVSGRILAPGYENDYCVAAFFLENEWIPKVEVSRSRILALPLRALLVMSAILNKYQMPYGLQEFCMNLEGWGQNCLKEWRNARTSQLDDWFQKNLADFFVEIKQGLQSAQMQRISKQHTFSISIRYGVSTILYRYMITYLQDNYQMMINYEEGQIISFYGKETNVDNQVFDIFPPMMFCKAATDKSRQYICHADPQYRRGITMNHQFIIWLTQNSTRLNMYYQRQFQQMVNCLCESAAENVIQVCNDIREQLLALPEHHGIDVTAFPKLSMEDFWQEEE